MCYGSLLSVSGEWGICNNVHMEHKSLFKIHVVTLIYLLTINFSSEKLLFALDRETNSHKSLSDCIQSADLKSENLVVFSEDINQNQYSTNILKILKVPVKILSIDSTLPRYLNCILFSKEVPFYIRLFKKNNTRYQFSYFIAWTWPFKNTTLENIFALAWHHKLMKVISFVQEKSSNVNVYTYFPYGPNRCGQVGPPLLLDTWDSRQQKYVKEIHKNKERILFDVMKNFYGCPLKVLVKNRPPDATAVLRNNSLVFRGGGGRILRTIKTTYNLTLSIELDRSGFHRDRFGYAITNKTVLKVNKMILTNSYDFAFGVFSYILNYYPETDFSHYFMIDKYVFHVPCGTVKVWSLWRDYYMEFSIATWASVAGLFVFLSICLKIITVLLPQENTAFYSFWDNVLRLMALHVENTTTLRVRTYTMRFALTLVMFYCTIMSVAYRSSLKSFITAPLEANSIQSWEELDKSNLKITGTLTMATLLNKIKHEHPALDSISKRFIIKATGEFSDIVDDVTVKKNTACLGPEGMVAYYNSIHNQENRTTNMSVCQVSPYVAESPASTFLVKRGSVFLTIINKVMIDHMQAGFMNYFGVSATIKTSSNRAYKTSLVKYNMKEAKGAFLLLLTGTVIAFLIFLLEMAYFEFRISLNRYC